MLHELARLDNKEIVLKRPGVGETILSKIDLSSSVMRLKDLDCCANKTTVHFCHIT